MPRYGNAEIANANQINNTPEREKLILATMRSIVGKIDVMPVKVAEVSKLLRNCDLGATTAVLKRVRDEFDGKFSKYPSFKDWKKAHHHVLANRRAFDGSTYSDQYEKPDEEEKSKVIDLCRQFQQKFPSRAEEHKEDSPYTKRFRRYRKYVEEDMVRVETRESELWQEWIPRKQAVMIGVEFHDPALWIEEKQNAVMCRHV